MQIKSETVYSLQLKITIPEDPTLDPTLTIKLGKGSIYCKLIQDLSSELKTIVNACVGNDIAVLKEIEKLTNNILPNNT